MKKAIIMICILAAIIGFSVIACSSDPADKLTGAVVAAPELESKTHNNITIKAVTAPENGQSVEYGIREGSTGALTWQAGLVFGGLNAQTNYSIFARSKEDDTYRAGTLSDSLEVTTDPDPSKDAGAEVGPPTLDSVTYTSITINAVDPPANGQTVEYAFNETDSAGAGLSSWQPGLLFDDLDDDTDYYIFARSAENSTHNAGNASNSLHVTTLKIPVWPLVIDFNHITLLAAAGDSPQQGREPEPPGGGGEAFFISDGKTEIENGTYEIQFALDNSIDISPANYFTFDMMVDDIELLDDISGGLFLWFSSSVDTIWVGFGASEAFNADKTGATQGSWFTVKAPIQAANANITPENMDVVKGDLLAVRLRFICGTKDPIAGTIYFRNFRVEQ